MTRLCILIVIGLPLIAAACQDVGRLLLIGAAFSTLLLFRRSAR